MNTEKKTVKVLILTDIHLRTLFAKYTLKQVLEYIARARTKYPGLIVVYLGDVVDWKGCHKKEVSDAYQDILTVMSVCDEVCMGNHELEFEAYQFVVIGKTLFHHGHRIYWSHKRLRKWKRKSPGRGQFGRYLAWGYSHWREIVQPKIKDKHMKAAILFANRHGCDRVVTGHKHPKRDVIRRVEKGVLMETYPRGFHILDVEVDG